MHCTDHSPHWELQNGDVTNCIVPVRLLAGIYFKEAPSFVSRGCVPTLMPGAHWEDREHVFPFPVSYQFSEERAGLRRIVFYHWYPTLPVDKNYWL